MVVIQILSEEEYFFPKMINDEVKGGDAAITVVVGALILVVEQDAVGRLIPMVVGGPVGVV